MRGGYSMSSSLIAAHSSLREHLSVVGLVVVLHAAAFAFGQIETTKPSVAINEMSVSFAQVQSEQTQVAAPPQKTEPLRQPDADGARPAIPPPQSVEPVLGVAPNTPLMEDSRLSPAAPVVLDTQPDYRADYLNNPRPSYPQAARRMGFQGKVVLNVEVLATGRAGQVQLHTSSGHEILDNAALQTVKTWHFSPARRLGQAVTEWFLVPVNFSLEDENA
jgi:protein TonB